MHDLSKLLFLDTETTGLGERDEIWQIAWQLGDKERNFFVHHDAPPSPWVLANTRYKQIFGAERTVEIVSLQGALTELSNDISRIDGRVSLAGNTPGFDDGHLMKHFAERPYHYQLIDVEVFACGALGRPTLSTSLEELRGWLGMPLRPADHFAHDAANDVAECRAMMVRALEIVRARS